MKLICKMRGHLPGPELWNEGLFFSTCDRCRSDIIRQRGGRWEAIPVGLRVVWRPSGHQGVHWSKAIGRARSRAAGPRASKLDDGRKVRDG